VIAQNRCPDGTKSTKLACIIPQVYGTNGLQAENPDAIGTGQFSSNFLAESLRPIEASIARQSALLPLASPSSGFIYDWDSTNKIFIQSTDSFGPIFGERAETIGRHRVFLGFAYQYLKFNSLDGVNLKKLPVLLTQPDDTTTFQGDPVCTINLPSPNPISSATGNPRFSNTGNCGYIRDVINSANSIDLKIHQFTTFITFGLTSKIDVSVAIPIENVRMAVSSDSTIVVNDSPTRSFHAFAPTTDCPSLCLHRVFTNSGTASGIGDITLRVKGTAWKGERAALALGVDVRVPTGDQLNFTGAGAAGVKPFVAWSFRSRVSPHVIVGYESNGSSVIAGDLSTGSKDKLPGQLTYSAGADFWLTKWLTTAVDLVGQAIFQGQRISVSTTHDLGACDSLSCQNPMSPKPYFDLTPSTGTLNITNASIGLKIRPTSTLLITGNVLVKLNEAGLRANVVPLVGISYTF